MTGDRGRPWFAAALVAFCVAALSACGKRSATNNDLERVRLPGFSIEVLPGRVVSTSKVPSDGRHELKLRKPDLFQTYFWKVLPEGTLSISWSSLTHSREEWKTLLLPAIIKSLDASAKPGNRLLQEASIDEHRWMYVIGTPTLPIGLGVIDCDPSFSVNVTLAHVRHVGRQLAELRRLVESVRCEVTAANTSRPLAATRLPAKFGRTPERAYQIFQTLDGEQVIVNFIPSDVQRDPTTYRHIIHALISEAFGVQIEQSAIELMKQGSPHPAGKSSLMRAQLPSTVGNIYVGTQYCAEIGLSLVSFWLAQDSSDALARERQSQLGCPGEPSVPTPEFATLADAACDAGDRQFCGLKEMPE
jgi:hypothetical protein